MPAFTMSVDATAQYCATNPTDPKCSSGPAWAQYLQRDAYQGMAVAVTNNGAATTGAGATDQTGIAPGTIVTTSASGLFNAIPLPIKILGVGALAFFGYRYYKKSHGGSKPLSGLFGGRRRRR